MMSEGEPGPGRSMRTVDQAILCERTRSVINRRTFMATSAIVILLAAEAQLTGRGYRFANWS